MRCSPSDATRPAKQAHELLFHRVDQFQRGDVMLRLDPALSDLLVIPSCSAARGAALVITAAWETDGRSVGLVGRRE